MAKTFYLNPDLWDLQLDGNGDLRIASGPLAIAQDVASACLTFRGEVWFDNTLGVPWKEDVLGELPPPGLIQRRMETEALRIAGVVDARAMLITDRQTRQTRGLITTTDSSGQTTEIML
ncbi:hypothetical protein MF265_18255 [Serratia marcescens]|uniref:hypothetical protein n=1 Tax=Serratia marcescens TaxID=615 RepID=UPI001EF08A20|nr:hypothetical protein [Serratia marcescens]ULH09879.1 hypothetical protein MF265_18255 [Serratia marcescens]